MAIGAENILAKVLLAMVQCILSLLTLYPKVKECLSSVLAKEPDFSVLVIGYSLGNIANLCHLTFSLYLPTNSDYHDFPHSYKALALPSWSQRDCLKAQKLRLLMADRSDDMKSNVR